MGYVGMDRRKFLLGFGAAVVSGTMAHAESFADQIVRQLRDQGLRDIEVSRTLLGRIRINAKGARGTREIILNPKTGEILRDIWLDADGNALLPGLANSDSDGSGGSGSSGDDDNSGSGSGDDDEEDDEDNSGHGSGDDDEEDDDKDFDRDDRDRDGRRDD